MQKFLEVREEISDEIESFFPGRLGFLNGLVDFVVFSVVVHVIPEDSEAQQGNGGEFHEVVSPVWLDVCEA